MSYGRPKATDLSVYKIPPRQRQSKQILLKGYNLPHCFSGSTPSLDVVLHIGRPTFIFFALHYASCHRQITVSHEWLSIRRLPRDYSPFLNIAENVFSLWKASVKQRLAEMHEELSIQSTHKQRMSDLATIA